MYRLSVLAFIVVFLLFIPPHLVYSQTKPFINEFLVHPTTGETEWVELSLSEGSDCAGCFIDDDDDFLSDMGSSKKYEIERILPGADQSYGIVELGSSLFNNDGDSIFLFDKDGVVLDQFTYTDDPGVGISIGRYPNRSGTFIKLAEQTKGSSNALPFPTPTPIPSPTEKPTQQPTQKPTVTPKQIPSATAFFSKEIPIPSAVPTVRFVREKEIQLANATNGAYPTLVLPTVMRKKRSIPTPTRMVLVKSASKVPSVFFIASGIAFMSCAILYVLRR